MKTPVPERKPDAARAAQRAGRSLRSASAEGARAHLLVATDCLSEGINLQDHFDAVVHYVLVECHDSPDPETGWRFTVKRYRSEKAVEVDGTWRHTKIVLEPLNPEFGPIILSNDTEGALRAVAEWVEVLKT